MQGETKVMVKVANVEFDCDLFRRNQKVWFVYGSGGDAAYVTGKHRGKGRWISAWINWNSPDKSEPEWREVEVERDFAMNHRMRIFEKNEERTTKNEEHE